MRKMKLDADAARAQWRAVVAAHGCRQSLAGRPARVRALVGCGLVKKGHGPHRFVQTNRGYRRRRFRCTAWHRRPKQSMLLAHKNHLGMSGDFVARRTKQMHRGGMHVVTT
jgi:hypothetical protein